MRSRRRADKPRKPKNIRNYVLWLLGRREWGEHELRTRLARRGCEAQEIDEALAYAKEQGFQSDTRYASMRARIDSSRRGNRRISYALKGKGISPDTIEQAISDLDPEADRAIAAVSRFEGATLDWRSKQKVWRFLGQRGFTPEAIRAAVAHLEQQVAAS